MTTYIQKLEEMLDIRYINEFVKVVNEKCKNVRKPKYTTEYYLYHIVILLTDLLRE